MYPRSDNAKKSDDKEIVKKHNPDIGKLDEMSERYTVQGWHATSTSKNFLGWLVFCEELMY